VVPDVVIAAAALMHDLALVTLSQGDFEGIPDLSLVPPPEEAAS
jgi:predicted nucleic acid-binding protein